MSQPQYAQRIIPCECGSSEPYWHGEGLRVYCCDACWAQMHAAATDADAEPGPHDPEVQP